MCLFFKVLFVVGMGLFSRLESMEESPSSLRKRKECSGRVVAQGVSKKSKEESFEVFLPNEILADIFSHVTDPETIGSIRLVSQSSLDMIQNSGTEPFRVKKRLLSLENPEIFQQKMDEEKRFLIKSALNLGWKTFSLIRKRKYIEAIHKGLLGMTVPYPVENQSWVMFPVLMGLCLWDQLSRKDPSFSEGEYAFDFYHADKGEFFKNKTALKFNMARDSLERLKEGPSQAVRHASFFGFYRDFIQSLNLGLVVQTCSHQCDPITIPCLDIGFLSETELLNCRMGELTELKSKAMNIYHHKICSSILSILSSWNDELKDKEKEEDAPLSYEEHLKKKIGIKLAKIFYLENEFRKVSKTLDGNFLLPMSLDYFETHEIRNPFIKRKNILGMSSLKESEKKRKEIIGSLKREEDKSQTYALLRALPKKNHPKVLYQLGLGILGGYADPDETPAMGIEKLRKAQELGCRKALFMEGISTCLGVGVARDLKKGLEMLTTFMKLYRKKRAPGSDYKDDIYYQKVRGVLNSLEESGYQYDDEEKMLINNFDHTCQRYYRSV